MELLHKKVRNFTNLLELLRLKVTEFLAVNKTKIKFEQDSNHRLVKEV